MCVYVPPEGSPFYPFFDLDNGIGILEECMTDCMLTLDNVYVILSGDLNSRTAVSYTHLTLPTRRTV